MKSIKKLAVTITLSASLVTLASTPVQTFKVFGKTVSFSLNDSWQTVNKEIGVPLKLMGPEFEGTRPVITLTPIDTKSESIKLDDEKEAELSYKTSRLAWLQKFNGSAIGFDPIKVYKVNNNEIHEFGLSYAFNNENFSEKSLYVECDKKLFNIKTLVKLEHVKKWEDEVGKIVNSFQCK